MADFTLDTSGEFLVRNGFMQADTVLRWPDLSPFEQGYVEAMFASIPTKAGRRRKFKNADLQAAYDYYRNGAPEPHAQKGNGSAGNGYYVGRCHPNPAKPFALPGSIAYAAWAAGIDLAAIKRPGFSDLAPETLAAIRKDCAAFALAAPNLAKTSHDGEMFWVNRQRGAITHPPFPPRTPTLGDDGRVYLREAS